MKHKSATSCCYKSTASGVGSTNGNVLRFPSRYTSHGGVVWNYRQQPIHGLILDVWCSDTNILSTRSSANGQVSYWRIQC